MTEFHYSVQGESLGKAPRQPVERYGHIYPLQNIIYFCPICGASWASIITETESLQFRAWHKTCNSCGGTGSLFRLYTEELQELPRLALEREIFIALQDATAYLSLPN